MLPSGYDMPIAIMNAQPLLWPAEDLHKNRHKSRRETWEKEPSGGGRRMKERVLGAVNMISIQSIHAW